MTDTLPAHSPVGASTAKRLLACPASVGPGVPGVEDDESEHATLGSAVHDMIEASFKARGDAWQLVGQEFRGLIATKSMANGAQVFLEAIRLHHPYRDQSNFFVERKFHCPTIHPLFFGTCDALYDAQGQTREVAESWVRYGATTKAIQLLAVQAGKDGVYRILHVWDFKNGAGVIVEVQENEQTQYYACGALEEFNLWSTVDLVVLHIVQPNGFHPDGRIRHWTTTPEDLAVWLEDVLVPGIERAMSSDEAVSGPHCNFCPKRFGACPALMADMAEREVLMDHAQKVGVDALEPAQVGRLLDLCKRAGIVEKALFTAGFGMLSTGKKIDGWKLVHKIVHRAWKDGAEARARHDFGEQAYTQPALKSPAQIDELPLGSTFTAEWAQKPPAGLTMAPASDKRSEVSRDTQSLFAPIETAKAGAVAPTLAPAKRRSTTA